MSWNLYPTYRGCENVQGWSLTWNGTGTQPFVRKRDAEAYIKANPNGPPKAQKLTYIDGKRVWSDT